MELIIVSILGFISTNIDDIFLLMLFFANKGNKTQHVVVGQYIGIISLIVISLIGSLADLLFDEKYIGLLGFIPVMLGIRGIVTSSKARSEEDNLKLPAKKRQSILAIASVTFANGADNIGIYVPLFSTISTAEKVIIVVIFLLMTALWCAIGKYISKHPLIARSLDTYGHIVTAITLIGLGIFIIIETKAYQLLH
jgi:cadmium resistance transport/sequestration family protein